MQAMTVETQGTLGRKLTLRLPNEQIERQMGSRLRDIATSESTASAPARHRSR